MGVHDIVVRKHVGGGASDHGRLETGVVAVLNNVEGRVGRADNRNRLKEIGTLSSADYV